MNEELKEALRQEDTILFIGSGVSCWSGLPSWSGLLLKLAHFLQSRGREGHLVEREMRLDLLQAASYGFGQLAPSEIGEFVRDACRVGSAMPHEIHRKIVALGPRCFITTNYDQLLEESLRKWRSGHQIRVVTNRQPFEEADIIQARALDFVFKPHGDVGDIDSLILTREQYRSLLEGGERRHALESLQTLLVTRRVVYLGFGLRDPDFLLVRDVLANTWKGGVRAHYAIMPDVEDSEVNYWRNNYGIHLISYSTTEAQDGSRDHRELLDVLDEFLQPEVPTAYGKVADVIPEEQQLSLLRRYASGLMRFESARSELPLRVRSSNSYKHFHPGSYLHTHWERASVDQFLRFGPKQGILIGLPGAGKTYTLRRAVALLAQSFYENSLSTQRSFGKLLLPMLVDMKLYGGSLLEMLELALPSGLTFSELANMFSVRLFLDSFNELPREQWERGSHELDIPAFLRNFPAIEIIIASRTDDGLSRLELPTYYLDEIDHHFLQLELERRGINLAGRFRQEMEKVLSKPFYFNLVANRDVKIREMSSPLDLFRSYFSNLSTDFGERFGSRINLSTALNRFAYEAINRGSEVLPVKAIYQSFSSEIQSLGLFEPEPEVIVNWLISKSFFLPYSEGRVAIFHQSITEFLAANRLAERFRSSPAVLKEKLRLNRWDYTIFLTLSMLGEDDAEIFLKLLMNADFSLALRATKYLEFNRDDVVSRLLSEIPEHALRGHRYGFEIESLLEHHVPVSDVHEKQLRVLMQLGNMMGGVAAAKLLNVKGHHLKSEMLQKLLEMRADYNFCSSVGRALREFVQDTDLRQISKLVDSVEVEIDIDKNGSSFEGFIAGLAAALAKIELSSIVSVLLPKGTQSWHKARVGLILNCLHDRHTTEALELAFEILLSGFRDAAVAVYFIATFGRDPKELSWVAVGEPHVSCLIEMLGNTDEENWALPALRALCAERADLVALVEVAASEARGLRQAALFSALGPAYVGSVFKALEGFLTMTQIERSQEPEKLLSLLELNWAGHEDLLLRLLKLRNTHLAWCLLEEQTMNQPNNSLIIEIETEDIYWWLDWLAAPGDSHSNWWFRDRLSRFFAGNLSSNSQRVYLAEFNRKDSKYRHVLADTILSQRSDLTTNDFSDDALNFLLGDLAKKNGASSSIMLLGRTATEEFVVDRLIPIVSRARKSLKTNIKTVLKRAGERHGRRYIPV